MSREIAATSNVDVQPGTDVVDGGGDGWLERMVLRDRATGSEQVVDADGLFVMIGASPHTGWVPAGIGRDPHGFVLTGADLPPDAGWPLERRPLPLETSMPGVLAAGDVRHGSAKRVASAVGEGSEAVQMVHRLFAADGRRPAGRVARPLARVGRANEEPDPS